MKTAKLIAAFMAMIFLVAGVSVSGASEYGCRVLLCMSNPAGPKAVSECVPTINKLLSDMKRSDFRWPPCEEAEAGGSRIVPTKERHELCPKGYEETPGGVAALKNADYQKALNPAQWIQHNETKYLKWIYPIYFSTADTNEEGYGMGWKRPADYIVCGRDGAKHADIAKAYEDDGEVKYRAYDNAVIYDKIAFARKIRAVTVVDIYIDGKLYKRVPLNF